MIPSVNFGNALQQSSRDHCGILQSVKKQELSQYVQQYLSAWKKRLELVDELTAIGRIEQVIEEYPFCQGAIAPINRLAVEKEEKQAVKAMRG